MCRGKPKFHPCGHQSVKYLHCPRATVDPTTNKTIPCNNVEYSSSQTLNSHCSIDECYWTSSAGVWYCCQCGHGPNPLGSCEGQSTRHGQPWRPSGVERPATQTCMHLWCRYCNPPTPGSIAADSIRQAQSKKGKRGGKGKGKETSTSMDWEYDNAYDQQPVYGYY